MATIHRTTGLSNRLVERIGLDAETNLSADGQVVLAQDMSQLLCGERQHLAARQLTGRLSKARNLEFYFCL
jgi:hypothetical protein